METYLNVIGVLLIALAFIHMIFPQYFNWKEELSRLSLINKQMMQMHTLFIALILFLMGILCWTSARELLQTRLGHHLCIGLGIFWFTRLMVQFVGYSPELWKGKTFETVIHILFLVLWFTMTAIFLIIGFS